MGKKLLLTLSLVAVTTVAWADASLSDSPYDKCKDVLTWKGCRACCLEVAGQEKYCDSQACQDCRNGCKRGGVN